jgi:predicted DNA binding protein
MATNQQQANTAAEGPATGTSGSDLPLLRVKLAVDPGTDTCPVADEQHGNGGEVQLVGDRCHVVFDEGTDGRDVGIRRSRIDESCACRAVCDAGVSPTNLSVENGSLLVEAIVESRDQLNSLSANLDAVDSNWSLQKLHQFSPGEKDDGEGGIAFIGDVSVTEKQRKAVRAAVERGYYETPRKISLGELAAEFEVSRSALSQRLIAVESKLVKGLATNL